MGKKTVLTLFIILISLIPALPTIQAEIPDYIIEGSRIYIDDSNAYISASPHTLPRSDYVYLNVTSKFFTGDVNFAFGFKSDRARPRSLEIYLPHNETIEEDLSRFKDGLHKFNTSNNIVYIFYNQTIYEFDENETGTPIGWKWELVYSHYYDEINVAEGWIRWNEFKLWKNLASKLDFITVEKQYSGMDEWKCAIENPVTAGVEYRLRVFLEIFPTLSKEISKYCIAFWPSHLTIQEAMDSGFFWLLDPWLTGGWDQRVKFTIDSGDIDGSLTNFTALVHLGTSVGRGSDDVSFIFDEVGANSKKIAVTTSDGQTECYVEIDEWDSGGEEAWLWIKVPSVASGSDTDLYLYYDNDHADNTAFVGVAGSSPGEEVWITDFIFVSHLKDNPNNTAVMDSTSGDNDGAKGFAGEPTTISAKIDDGQDFDGTNDHIDFTQTASISENDPLTMSLWIKPTSTPDEADDCVVMHINNDNDRYSVVFSNDDKIRIAFKDAVDWRGSRSGPITPNIWVHVVYVFNGEDTGTLYLNGSLQVGSDTPSSVSGYVGFRLGERLNNLRDYAGLMDEVKFLSVAKSSAWAKATYESECDDLLDWGAEEEEGGENSSPTIISVLISNRKDTDNIYVMDGYSTYVVEVDDNDTAADIEKVYLQIKNGAEVIGEFRATSLTGTPAWAIQTGSSVFDLDTGSCSWDENVNEGTATFKIRAEGDIPQYDDLELAVYVEDTAAASAGFTDMQTDYFDIISRLVTESLAASDTRINKGGTGIISGAVYYATTTGGDTASFYSPPNDQFTAVRVHDSGHTIRGSDTSIVSGAFSVSFAIPDANQLNTYHIYPDMVGDWGDADAPDGDTAAIIGDCIELVSVDFDDSRINIGGTAEVRYVLRYAYDSVSFTGSDGSIVDFSWDGGNSWWDKAVSAPSSPGADNYDENDLGAITDNNYGITAKEDDAGASLIGDKYNVTDLWASDYVLFAGDNVTLYAEFESLYDSHVCDGDDSITIEDLPFTFDPIEEWFFASVGKNESGIYDVDTLNSIYEHTYDITTGQMGLNISVTWVEYTAKLFGLYYENGTYAGNVSISVYFEDYIDIFTLEDNATINYVEIPLMYLWNLPGGASRTIYTSDKNETYYIFTPDGEYSAYSFTVKDYTSVIGDADSYLEILLNVNGTERLIEKDLIWDTSNPVVAILEKNNRYKLQIRDGKGELHVFDYFLPISGVTPDLIIDDIPFSEQVHYVGEYVSVEALRPDYEHIRINYRDERDETTSIFVEICYMNGTQVWNAVSTDSMVQFNWYSAVNTTHYLVNLVAQHELVDEVWYTNALAGCPPDFDDYPSLEVFGNAGKYIIPVGILMVCLSVGDAGMTGKMATTLMVCVAYMMHFMNWLPVPIMAIHLGMFITVAWWLQGRT